MNEGTSSNTDLSISLRSQLGVDIPLGYFQPQLAGGVFMTPAGYSIFLRKIVSGNLSMKQALGTNAVCTNPKTCATASSTPIPETESWSYSLGHWIESDPQVVDGAFSSAGAFGFYPWIDQSKTWYGLIARVDAKGDKPGYASAQCGRLIGKAQ